MMDFPLEPLLDPQACYDFLLDLLHPDGLGCPRGHPLAACYIHERHRAPLLHYRCKACGCCFNLFSGTVLQATKYHAVQIVQLLRGIAQGVSTAQLAREIGVDRKWLLVRRHQLQNHASQARDQTTLDDGVVEADEMYQNAGEKRHAAS